MAGEMNLEVLLSAMQPELLDTEFVFVTIAGGQYGDAAQLSPKAMFLEHEGMTLVIPKLKADEFGHHYECVFQCITLNVHSSLEAVGLTAAFASKLAEHDISANVLAGYYHDHIFVQRDKAQQAMVALNAI
ncbi:ACT domain-containing protein [Pseudoalteromonas sp. JBTF-M23]|uniref:ACT domain-containing protein n=1 Tax=Pseudoalteromonas caenipelagi TaxID=2726988 RepID=A0A849VAK4_9GAMM|nr:ACT domain-containing protein [Pseudoalteromonas caenipelagi]NOU49800.1 ACT domain-containing protein [Pseudoalteromonas caenipelagi]